MPHTPETIEAPDAEATEAEAKDGADTAGTVDIWSVAGVFQQLVYSPKGAVEGVLIDTDGIPTQFVTDPHDMATGELLATLRPGQALVLEGTEAGASPKGEPPHTVYAFERLASVDGQPPRPTPSQATVAGKVVRLNHARHGAPNGVLLDSGDFVHTRPDGFEQLGLKIGDRLEAVGPARPLATGGGRVIEAHRANGHVLAPKH